MGTVYRLPYVPQVDFNTITNTLYSNLSSDEKTVIDTVFARGLNIYDGLSYNKEERVYLTGITDNVLFTIYLETSGAPTGTGYYHLHLYGGANAKYSTLNYTVPTTEVNIYEVHSLEGYTLITSGVARELAGFLVDSYSSDAEAQEALENAVGITFPITYHYTNSTVSGPSEATVGETVVVSAVPDNNYGITDPTSQISVTNNDVAVSYEWNPSTNTITFVMPDPS